MQCGVCAGSCPLGPHWEHSPQKIFMMIRAGKREEVLTSDSMWMCTSCYNCIVRCPRKLPITHIMHGLANYAHRLGLAPKSQPTREFSPLFWDNLHQDRPRQRTASSPWALYFKDGFVAGRQERRWSMQDVGLGLMQGEAPEPDGAPRRPRVQGPGRASQRMLAKAHEIEDAPHGEPAA